MKIANLSGPNGPTPAIIVEDSVVAIGETLSARGHHWRDLGEAFAASGLDVLRGLQGFAKEQAAAGKGTPVAKAKFLPPVLTPPRIVAVAANYRAHVLETKVIEDAAREETAPWFFDKPLRSLCSHGDPIRLPSSLGKKVDWEAELAVVIGKTARKVSVERALDHVLGYTIVNDISAREMDVPGRTKIRDRDKFHDWLHGKWFDSFCPTGPWIVTADEIPDPQALQISLSVNGQRYQHASTADMLFTTAELISFASHITTLEPGCIVATGTPSGVGKASGRFLTQGDTVSITISGIGTLENRVVTDD